jgi:hypothetical protein
MYCIWNSLSKLFSQKRTFSEQLQFSEEQRKISKIRFLPISIIGLQEVGQEWGNKSVLNYLERNKERKKERKKV